MEAREYLPMGTGKDLSNAQRLCATLLFYFQAGMDAKAALDSDARAVDVPSPTDDDLRKVRASIPAAMWEGVMEIAEAEVRQIAASEPRDAVTSVRDAVSSIRDFKNKIDGIFGPSAPLHETIAKPRTKKR